MKTETYIAKAKVIPPLILSCFHLAFLEQDSTLIISIYSMGMLIFAMKPGGLSNVSSPINTTGCQRKITGQTVYTRVISRSG